MTSGMRTYANCEGMPTCSIPNFTRFIATIYTTFNTCSQARASRHIDSLATDVYTCSLTMKTGIHPDNYRTVVFEDLNNGTRFLTRSTVAAEETIKWEDGNDYPLVKVHISSASHPFFTGEERIVDVEGRVDKFKARAAAGQAAREQRTKAVKKHTLRKQAKQVKQASKEEAKSEE